MTTQLSWISPSVVSGRADSRVHRVHGLSRAKIETKATSLLSRLCPQLLTAPGMVPILDIIEFALPEHFGIDYGVSDRLPPGVEATTVPRGSRGRPEILFNEAVFVRLCDHHRRFRFTASHEIAHALIHISQIEAQFVHGNIPVLYRRQQLRPYEDPEWQADQFAAALLMPTRAVMALVDTVGADISEVADTFKVSHTAAGKRIGFMRKEGLIT